MVKVLVVDDSALIRKVLTDILAEEPEIEIVGVARNGIEAIEKIQRYKPDIVTLDVEMPQMDGIETLEQIMLKYPTPVIMVSSLTLEGAQVTLKALEIGAVDFITKPSRILGIDQIRDELLEKIRTVAKIDVEKLLKAPEPKEAKTDSSNIRQRVSTFPSAASQRLIAIGTSTGGPRALQELLPKLPANLPCGVVIVQHMPAGFTSSMAERLDKTSQIRVREAQDGDKILPGIAYLAPGNYHMFVQKTVNGHVVRINQEPPYGGHRPSVDILFKSVAQTFGPAAIGVLLTGMGKDGADGLKLIRGEKGRTIAEDESTCVVYGMPRAAVENGAAEKVHPLPDIADEIVKLL